MAAMWTICSPKSMEGGSGLKAYSLGGIASATPTATLRVAIQRRANSEAKSGCASCAKAVTARANEMRYLMDLQFARRRREPLWAETTRFERIPPPSIESRHGAGLAASGGIAL